jgi:hypothetical protein
MVEHSKTKLLSAVTDQVKTSCSFSLACERVVRVDAQVRFYQNCRVIGISCYSYLFNVRPIIFAIGYPFFIFHLLYSLEVEK